MPRVSEAGDSALLLELEAVIDDRVNAQAIAAAAAVRRAALPGVRDVVSTYRSVAVYFDPLIADVSAIRRLLGRRPVDACVTAGRRIEVPVVYGGEAGPDLADVAAFAKLRPEQVIERHAGDDYRVFMLGFMPGFAYMGIVPEAIAAPRRPAPRLRVRAGSVGIAGRQTAVYPRDSPGGWQIIGRTPMTVFDARRLPAAVFAPGDTVRFVRETGVQLPPAPVRTDDARGDDGTIAPGGRTLTVVRPGLFSTVQDCGRWGHQSSGVPVGGAMDLVSHRTANALVGNRPAAATIEATVTGPELRLDADAVVAIAGADLDASVDEAPIPMHLPVSCRRGAIVRFGGRRSGTRAYLAVAGGIAVPEVLGSRATHAAAGLGGWHGRALRAGDRLPIGEAAGAPVRRRVDVHPAAPGGIRVRVLPGPQDDCFPREAFGLLERARFNVSAHADRMGYRLQGPRLPRVEGREMISDATFTGALQVPASGEPILLMADRQTAGGYPQIATVITADLPLAAQLAPGDWIEFRICSRADAISALVAQEARLLAIG